MLPRLDPEDRAASPGPASFKNVTEILSQASAPLQSITDAHRSTPVHEPRLAFQQHCTFRGLFPFDVFPVTRSSCPASPTSTGPVPPSGFLTLSTSCSPHDLSDLFHSESAPGVRPSRLYSFRVAVRPFERRPPPVVSAGRRSFLCPTPGFDTPRKSRPGPWGLARCPTDASLGFLPFEVSSPSG